MTTIASDRSSRFLLLILLAIIPPTAEAQAIDPHRLFETRCGRCHDHAGELARETLIIENAELVSKKTGQRLRDFLPDHFGKLNVSEISLLSETFKRQVQTGGLYQKNCRICHEPARLMARRNLILRNGELIGRYDGADIKRLLTYHGRLSKTEQTIVHDMLVWHLLTAEDQDTGEKVSFDDSR